MRVQYFIRFEAIAQPEIGDVTEPVQVPLTATADSEAWRQFMEFCHKHPDAYFGRRIVSKRRLIKEVLLTED